MKKWTYDGLIAAISSHGLSVVDSKEIQHGQQITLAEGSKINWYTSGKTVIQGKDCEEKTLLQAIADGGAKPVVATLSQTGSSEKLIGTVKEPKVFIVYGHDTQARDQLELMLLRMNIKPVILGNMTPDGKTIIEALIANTDVPYAVVLLTPDDEGHKAGDVDKKAFRARQNVVLELGMFLAKLGRDKVAILHKGTLELPSDIHGLIYIPFEKSIQEGKNKLAASLQKAGFYIDIEHLQAD